MSELFRKEAIEHHTKKLDGEVMILPRLSHTVATVFIVIWVIALIIWLSVSKYSKKETVKGWLEPAHGVTKVYSGSEGIITEVLVSEGEEVAINQPLAIVNGDRLLTDGNRLQSTLLQQYKKQKDLVKKQLQRIQEIHLARLENMSQQISSERQNLLFIQDQIATKNQQLELVSTQLKNYEKLSKEGHASVYEENRSKKEFLSFVSDVQALRRTKVNQENTIQQLINEKGLLPEEHKNNLDKLQAELSQLNAEIAQINAKQAYYRGQRKEYIWIFKC